MPPPVAALRSDAALPRSTFLARLWSAFGSASQCLMAKRGGTTRTVLTQKMPIDSDDVRHAAKLSRLNLTDAEVAQFTNQLARVLEYVSKLNELDVTAVEPIAHALDITNVLREDEPVPGMDVDQVLANAPAKSPPFFKVPKVLGGGSGA